MIENNLRYNSGPLRESLSLLDGTAAMQWFDKRKTALAIYGDVTSGQRPWWARPFVFSNVQTVMRFLATALLLYSVVYGFARVNCRNFDSAGTSHIDECQPEQAPKPNPTAPTPEAEKRLTGVGLQKAVLIMIWVLVPPMWFWFEYYGIWRYEDKQARQSREKFQLGQELSSKIWLAAVTALGILYFGKDIKGGG